MLGPRFPPFSPSPKNPPLVGIEMLGPAGRVMVTVSGAGWVIGAMLPGIVTVIPGIVMVLAGIVTVFPGLVIVGPGTVTVVVTVGTGTWFSKPGVEPGVMVIGCGHEQAGSPSSSPSPSPLSWSWPWPWPWPWSWSFPGQPWWPPEGPTRSSRAWTWPKAWTREERRSMARIRML